MIFSIFELHQYLGKTCTTTKILLVCTHLYLIESNPISDWQGNCIIAYMSVTWKLVPNRMVTKCFN